jgi:UDP-glucose 4-epimerase
MPTVVVTGAAGFLGSYILRELIARSWRVVGTDRTGSRDLRILDLPSPELAPLLQKLRPEVIVHAAGPASVPRSLADPAADFRESMLPLLNVLDAIRQTGLSCRVVYLSSAAVYGNPAGLPVSESHPAAPISPSGYHKWMGEKLIEEYHRVYGLGGCSVRIFSAYGRGLRRQVLWDAAWKILRGPVAELIGTGRESRDFVHASDVARGIAAVVEHGAFESEVYNLGSGRETSIAELAHLLAGALGRQANFTFSGSARTGDPARWYADITRLSRLGYEPQVDLRDGVADFAAWVVEQTKRGESV